MKVTLIRKLTANIWIYKKCLLVWLNFDFHNLKYFNKWNEKWYIHISKVYNSKIKKTFFSNG